MCYYKHVERKSTTRGTKKMMMSEFIERTGYEPDLEEYHYIEESYYEFPGNKDEFCKQWLKDNKDGHWQREMSLMKAMDQMKAQYEENLKEQEENLEFYRPYFEKAYKAEKELAEATNKLDRIQRILNSDVIQ